METILLLGILFLLYQSGSLSSIGLFPSSTLLGTQRTSAQLSNVIGQEETVAMQQTGSNFGYSGTATIGSDIASGTSAGAAAGPYGAAAGAASGAISGIFNGMRIRAQQATIENQALNYAVAAFDQALRQINAAYSNRQIGVQDAIALIQQAYSAFWGIMAQKIQPNRNGCASGSQCPGTAIQYAAQNGVPGPCPGGNCYCSGTIGATCCVGCGPIRLTVERTIQVLQAGGGTVQAAPVGGDKYGLQTRLGYTLIW